MKIKVIFPLTIYFLLLQYQNSNSQDFIKDFDGIPLITYAPHDMGAYQYDHIKTMGIDAVIASNVTTERLVEINNQGIKVIPWQVDTTIYEPNFNDILKYSDARYSIWEAEGTDAQKGDATLKYNNEIVEPLFIDSKAEGIVTKANANTGLLLTGPGYRQEIYYRGINLNRIINYTACLNIKVEYNNSRKIISPSDTICIFQITNSTIRWNRIIDKIVIKEIAITFGDFTKKDWNEICVDYNFLKLNPKLSEVEYFPSKNWAEFVDFNVIWQGNSYSKLFIDKIIISDERGRELMTQIIHDRIAEQDKKAFSLNIDDSVVGWSPIDEPESIDNYEPIRLVDSILNKVSAGKRRLWISFPSSWNGKYGDSNLGAEPLFKWREFTKRTQIIGKQNNHTIFDYPLSASENPLGGDFRKKNIDLFIDSVLSIIKLDDSLFTLCLQGGRYDGARLFKDPSPKEILYTANLGLLYGAKALTIYRYFGEDNNPKHSGVVNYTTKDGYIFTDKYYFFKDVLSPRLKGEFGKTIKRLRQTQQIAGIDLISNKYISASFVKMIEAADAKSNDTSIVELGFFKDWGDDQSKYFMLVNRYYSSTSKFNFTIQNLKPNSSYEVKDLIDDKSEKLFVDKNGLLTFSDSITPGDGRLYRLKLL